MPSYRTENIRNVALLSHSGAGKTSLSEAMLFAAAAITRLGRVDDGTSTSDYEPEETKRKISINLSLLPLEWHQSRVNLLDTPGYADFAGEVFAGLRVADGALLVVCAASGVEVGTELAWRYVEERGLPCIVFINKMERENADFFRTLKDIEEKLGRKSVPFQLPIGSQRTFEGIFDLVSPADEVPPALAGQVEGFREKLIEAAAETDDELITKYLEGEELSDEEVRRGLRAGVLGGKVIPVLTGSALQNKGIAELLSAICDYLPSPQDRGALTATVLPGGEKESLDPNDGAPLAAIVFKTTADPYVGKLTYLRVYSGTAFSDSTIWNASRSKPERVGQLYSVRGKAQEPMERLVAGDIGAVAKLAETSTSDTLSSRDKPLLLDPIGFPSPTLSMAIHPKSKADVDKLGPALARLAEEDPTLKARKEPDTSETLLSGLGEAHFDVAADKMKRKFGVDVDIRLPKIPYKETITTTVKTEYKHKKQTGGHGQYGHVFLELEPLPRGSGTEFAARVVGGSVPKNYITAVDKGVNEALQEGMLANYPITDIRVTLYDGSSHPVDSSDIAFKIAAAHGLRKGVSQGQPVLLEPIMNIHITVPEAFTGDIMSDLNGKRGRVQGMNPQDGTSVIDAQAPLAELQRYATDLRSITQGRGHYTMEFSHYEEVPSHTAQKIIAEAKKKEEKT